MDFLQQKYLGNTIETYLLVLLIILAGLLFKKLISTIISWCLYKIFKQYTLSISLKEFRDLLVKPFGLFIITIMLFVAFDRLEFPPEWNLAPADKPGLRMTLHILFYIALIISLTQIILRVVDIAGLILQQRARHTVTKMDDQFVPFIKSGLKILIIVFSFFFILGAVFHVNVVALVGGLGIGGLAFALAGKETAENLLGSFTIFLDKPFTLGDQVRVGNTEGIVENIGLRSTRIRTLERSLITIPNKKMVDVELENVTLKTMHRARFFIGLKYDSPAEQIRRIINEIEIEVQRHQKIRENPIVKLNEFSSSSLDILIIYFVMTSEAEEFIAVKEEINFLILDIVKKNNCSFAFPSTSLYWENK